MNSWKDFDLHYATYLGFFDIIFVEKYIFSASILPQTRIINSILRFTYFIIHDYSRRAIIYNAYWYDCVYIDIVISCQSMHRTKASIFVLPLFNMSSITLPSLVSRLTYNKGSPRFKGKWFKQIRQTTAHYRFQRVN